MNAQESTKLNMYNAVISQLTGESSTLAIVPALKKGFGLFVVKAAALNGLIPSQSGGSTRESFTKAQAKSIRVTAYADFARQA